MSFDNGEFATKIVKLHAESGLDWRQVGKLFDVFERTVRWWASGYAKPVSRADKRCDELMERLSLWEEKTPEERRRKFLSSREGMSIFHRWCKEVQSNSPIIQFDSMNLYRDYYKD